MAAGSCFIWKTAGTLYFSHIEMKLNKSNMKCSIEGKTFSITLHPMQEHFHILNLSYICMHCLSAKCRKLVVNRDC